MDITLSGKIYVYFIKSVFESNKKIGVELIINIRNSDSQLIDGLIRLNKLNKNKIFIKIDDIKIPLKLYDTRYFCNIIFEYSNEFNKLNNSSLILKEMNSIEYEKYDKVINNKFKLQNYSTGKNKTVQLIMDKLKYN
jgi:hypothetical protein